MKCRHVWYAALMLGMLMAPPALGQVLQYSTDLSGQAEHPPNDSPGVGSALLTIDLDAMTMRVQTSFSGLSGTVSAAHIHCCIAPDVQPPAIPTAGVATMTPTFLGFPSDVTEGTYDMTFDLTAASTYNASFVNNNGGTPESAAQALLEGIADGEAYLNIHTQPNFGAGEIRGFFQVVPEPTAGLILLLSGLAFPLLRRRSA